MPLNPLTKRLEAVLAFIADKAAINFVTPTFAEIALRFGTNQETAFERAHALELNGYVRIKINEARSITLTHAGREHAGQRDVTCPRCEHEFVLPRG